MSVLDPLSSPDLLAGPSLPGRLVDEICEAVGRAQTPEDRSNVVRALVEEICQAVEWRRPPGDGEELASLEQIRAAARTHADRMAGQQ